jgi:hypothetical protein
LPAFGEHGARLFDQLIGIGAARALDGGADHQVDDLLFGQGADLLGLERCSEGEHGKKAREDKALHENLPLTIGKFQPAGDGVGNDYWRINQ